MMDLWNNVKRNCVCKITGPWCTGWWLITSTLQAHRNTETINKEAEPGPCCRRPSWTRPQRSPPALPWWSPGTRRPRRAPAAPTGTRRRRSMRRARGGGWDSSKSSHAGWETARNQTLGASIGGGGRRAVHELAGGDDLAFRIECIMFSHLYPGFHQEKGRERSTYTARLEWIENIYRPIPFQRD